MSTGPVPTLFDVPPGPPGQPPELPPEATRPAFIKVQGTLFRFADYDTPTWSRPNSRSGRWHEADGKTSAQYWAYQPDTAWAEKLRAEGIRDPDDVPEMHSRVWAGQIEVTEVADLTTPEWQAWLSFGPTEMLADDHGPCRRAAAAVRGLGAAGIVVHSAAMPERRNLIIFKRMSLGDWYEQPGGQPVALRHPEKLIAARLVAWGHPDPQLVHRVVYRGA